MTVDSSLVDGIVHGVLRQLESPPAAERPAPASSASAPSVAPKPGIDHRLAELVITARLIEEQVPRSASAVVVSPRAVITPAALDVVRSRKLIIRRENASSPPPKNASPLLAIVVRNTPAI